jgi:hypothetical protein
MHLKRALVPLFFPMMTLAFLAGCAHAPTPVVPALEGKPFISINKSAPPVEPVF